MWAVDLVVVMVLSAQGLVKSGPLIMERWRVEEVAPDPV